VTRAENRSGTRIDVRKTYKLYIGGQFPRSESGHSYVVDDAKGRFVANAALASRKDARDAVLAARAAFGGWSGKTAYNRAQILYRVAEVMEDRRPQFVEAVRQSEGLTPTQAGKVLDLSIDRLVWYAGWADKITQVTGNANPVAGPFFNLSTPEPTGVVGVVAPQQSSLLGLVSVVAPVVVTGNTAVVLSSYERPLPAVTFSEVLATSDVPGGVVNILTGRLANTAPTLASHMDVNGIDLTGFAGDAGHDGQARALEEAAAENLKRVLRPPAAEPDWALEPGIERMTTFLETKTVWHPIGV
jgi:acyl-CoA reductase-like NAD-dependent aldehyde dehydrogenase